MRTTILLFTRKDTAEVARLLLEAGAHVDLKDKELLTPGQVAKKYNSVSILEVFENHSPSI